ncbi:hypothetical protein DSM26151_14610 [Agromyces marinus]|nr:hypothetical protein DSM26151_14610 [Agromyces marinus]
MCLHSAYESGGVVYLRDLPVTPDTTTHSEQNEREEQHHG